MHPRLSTIITAKSSKNVREQFAKIATFLTMISTAPDFSKIGSVIVSSMRLGTTCERFAVRASVFDENMIQVKSSLPSGGCQLFSGKRRSPWRLCQTEINSKEI